MFKTTHLFKQDFADVYSVLVFCHLPRKKREQRSNLAGLFVE